MHTGVDVGGTKVQVVRVDDGEVVAEERIGRYVMGRIRSLAVDADGLVYLGSDNGEIWRLRPAG